MAYRIDDGLLEKLRMLPADRLKELIYSLCRSAGMKEASAAMIAAGTPALKRKLDSVSAEELNRILSAVPEEELRKLAQTL